MTHVTNISYKLDEVKYSQHCLLICRLQPIAFCHFGLCSLRDEGASCHLASQQHLSALLFVLEVAAAWCPVAGRSPEPWRRAALGHTAGMSPCLIEAGGVQCCVLWGHQKLDCDWCMCHLARLL